MNELIILTALRGATIIAGAIFIVYALQAYRTYQHRAMLVLASAIGLMVFGVVLEGVAFYVFGASLGLAETLEAGVMLLAFLVLLWSVRRPRQSHETAPRERSP